jgi:hypothetical protein
VLIMSNDVGKLGSRVGGYTFQWKREQLEGVLPVQAVFSKTASEKCLVLF